jgi:hypothetical protein
MEERGRMAVLMKDGSHARREGADLYMPNADIYRIGVAPLTTPIENSDVFNSPEKSSGSYPAVVTLPMSEVMF